MYGVDMVGSMLVEWIEVCVGGEAKVVGLVVGWHPCDGGRDHTL